MSIVGYMFCISLVTYSFFVQQISAGNEMAKNFGFDLVTLTFDLGQKYFNHAWTMVGYMCPIILAAIACILFLNSNDNKISGFKRSL